MILFFLVFIAGFFPGRHDIAEILLKVALKHQKFNQSMYSKQECSPFQLTKSIVMCLYSENIVSLICSGLSNRNRLELTHQWVYIVDIFIFKVLYVEAHTLHVDYVLAHTLYVEHAVAHTLYVDHVLAHTLYVDHVLAHTLYVDCVLAHTLYVDYVLAHTLYVDYVLAHTLYVN